jgi:hypothetical protein
LDARDSNFDLKDSFNVRALQSDRAIKHRSELYKYLANGSNQTMVKAFGYLAAAGGNIGQPRHSAADV